MIKVIYNKVCGRCVQSEPLTSGMVGQPIHFEYSHDFDGLAVTAVFTDGKNTVDVVNPGNECIIPHEVLTTVGAMVKVGIYAVRGNELVIPTIYAHIGVVLKGADPSGDVSIDPTLPIWAQTQALIGNLNDLTTEAKNNLVAAINEAAQSGGGGGSSIALDTTLTVAGAAADAKAVGDVTIRQAELGEDGVASFKNAAGIVLFTVDFSNLTPAVYGDMVISAEAVEIAEGGSGTFAVHLATAPTVNQPVYLAVSDNTRLSVSPSSLTFTPENYATPQTVTVTAAQDDDADDDTITVTLTSRKVDAKQLIVNIVDDDKPVLVENGLEFYINLRNMANQNSADTQIVDSVGGVVCTTSGVAFDNTSGFLDNDGLTLPTSSTVLQYKYPIKTENVPRGFTYEITTKGHGAFYGAGSGWGNGYAYKFKVTNYSYLLLEPDPGVAGYNAAGTLISYNKVVNVRDSSYYTEFDSEQEHVFSAVNEIDGTFNVYIDGILCFTMTPKEEYSSHRISGTVTFKIPYNSNYYKAMELASVRIYERALTADEVLQNAKYDISQRTVQTF